MQAPGGGFRLKEQLFNDCHASGAACQTSFANPYTYSVAMGKERFSQETVYLDEIIQGCMLMPLAARSLPWPSMALTGYVA